LKQLKRYHVSTIWAFSLKSAVTIAAKSTRLVQRSHDAGNASALNDVADDVSSPPVHFLQLLAKSSRRGLGQDVKRVRQPAMAHAKRRENTHGEQTARRFSRQTLTQLEVEARVVYSSSEANARESVDHEVDPGTLDTHQLSAKNL
jgi:hypothetical protein